MHKRPPVEEYRPEPDGSVVFMQTKTSSVYLNDANEEATAQIRLWGVTPSGHSITLLVNDFKPYMYVDLPPVISDRSIVSALKAYLQSMFPDDRGYFVKGVEHVKRRNIMGYMPEGEGYMDLLKLEFSSPKFVAKARDALEDGVITNGLQCPTYEGNVLYTMRFMADIELSGCQWVRCPAGTVRRFVTFPEAAYDPTEDNGVRYRTSLGFECMDYKRLEPISFSVKGNLGRWRWLSYDIEACRERPGFCKATEDRVSQVCFYLFEQGRGCIYRKAFCLVPQGKSCDPIAGVDLETFEDEVLMMRAIRKFMLECDFDFLTGWNVDKFDNPYMMRDRPHALGGKAFRIEISDLGRVSNKSSYIRNTTLKSKAYGTIKSTEMVCAGRSCYDGYMHTRLRERLGLRSYGLNNVAEVVLKKNKVDVPHWQIAILQNGTDAERARLTYYCMVDAELPMSILQKRMALENGAEQARVTGIDFAELLGGEGRKTYAKLLRLLPLYGMTVPSTSPIQNDETTQGGLVFVPLDGYYVKCPIATLDFMSLYPSIMKEKNVGYDSYCSLAWAREHLQETDYNVPPGDNVTYCFVRAHIHYSIMAKMVHDLLEARKAAKAEMKLEQDPARKAVLNARQIALKLCCNSVYGFFKAYYLCNKHCMDAVTAWGRDMLMLTRDLICGYFTPEHTRAIHDVIAPRAMNFVYAYMQDQPDVYSDLDLEHTRAWRINMMIYYRRDIVDVPATLIYGDTDSVMINFGEMSNERCWYLGERAAFLATAHFGAPNELECEAIKNPAVMIKKKGYIVREREWATDKGKVKVQGETSKRRDNFPLVANLQGDCAKLLLRDASDGGPDVLGAIRLVHQTCKRLLECRVDIRDLILSSTFSKTLEEYEEGGTHPAHVELWKKKQARAHITGEYLESTGDRVPYVIMPEVNSGTRKAKKYTRVEDPEFCMKAGRYPDPLWYLEQLKNPLLRLFSPVFTGDLSQWVTPEIRKDSLIQHIYRTRQAGLDGKLIYAKEQVTQKISNSKQRLHRLMAHKILFEGPHMRVRVHRSIRMEQDLQNQEGSAKTSLTAYVVKRSRCMSCMNHLPVGSAQPLCTKCRPNQQSYYMKLISKYSNTQQQYNAAWTRCQRCQGSLHTKVVCGNRDCDNFYRRISLTVDLEDIGHQLKRFEI